MGKKILILGAAGNLGSQLVKFFEAGNELILWDRKDVDVLDFDLLREKIRENKPNIIFNCVAYNAVDKCEQDETEFEIAKKLNGELVGVLADLALELDAVLVHYVSDYVFAGDKKEGYAENDKTNPVSNYGISKEMGETEIFKRAGEGLKYYLIRTSKLFGPKGPSEASKESFFDLILRLSATQKEFKMVDGEEISFFTYTVDLAHATKVLFDSHYEYGVYHIVNEEAASWYDGAKYMFEILNIKDINLIPVKSGEFSRPAKRPKYSLLLNTKFIKLRSYAEALEEYLLGHE